MLEKSKLRPYRTKSKVEHLLDIYADDLSIYLEFDRRRTNRNKENVKEVLKIMEIFYKWSGLKINLSKTYIAIFGSVIAEPKFIQEMKLKWCTSFKLLGITFDVTLSNMQINYQKGLESIKKELFSWKYRHLTIFGKLVVIKTLCLPKLTHVVTVVPNPVSYTHLTLPTICSV